MDGRPGGKASVAGDRPGLPRPVLRRRADGGSARLAVFLTVILGLLLAMYLMASRSRHPEPATPAPPAAMPDAAPATPPPPVAASAPAAPAPPAPPPTPPPPVETPAPPPAPTPSPPPEEVAQRKKAVLEEAQRLASEGEKAAAAQRHDDALESYAAADALLKSLPEDAGREAERTRIAGLAAEAARARDEKRRREREAQFERRFAEARRLADETSIDAWEQAIAVCEELERGFPEKKDALAAFLAPVRKKRDDANAFLLECVRKSGEETERVQFGAAFEHIRKARIWKPKDPRLDQASAAVRAALARHDLVRIPAGPFLLGSDDPQDRAPRRTVSTPEFLIDRTEVTNQVYLWFCDDTGHPPPPFWGGKKPPSGFALYPVTGVTAADAEAFAQWLGKRLPTEEEWEKAARGLDGRTWPWGNTFPDKPPCQCAATARSSVGPGADPGPAPVGRMAEGQSVYGVVDMAGNVWEWTTGKAPLPDDASVEGRVLRGGSFASGRDALRCARRYIERPDAKLLDAGFRCVKAP